MVLEKEHELAPKIINNGALNATTCNGCTFAPIKTGQSYTLDIGFLDSHGIEIPESNGVYCSMQCVTDYINGFYSSPEYQLEKRYYYKIKLIDETYVSQVPSL